MLQETFDEPGWPSVEKWGETANVLRGTHNATQTAIVTDENSAELGFDGSYLKLFKETNESASVWVVGQNKLTPGSPIMTAEFDYHRAGGFGLEPIMRFGEDDPISTQTNRTTSQFRFENTGFSGVANLVEDDKTYRITWVYNNSHDPVTYADGFRTLASESYDVWINGKIVLRDHQFTYNVSRDVPVGEPITSFGIGFFGRAMGDFRMDNLTIYGGAWVTDPDFTVTPAFADDFTNPIDGKPSVELWGSIVENDAPPARAIEVVNDSADLFQEGTENNYMRIFNDGVETESDNVNLIAFNRFGSTVITVDFDFIEPTGVGESNLVLRPGAGIVDNTNRTHEITFNNGELSGKAAAYSEGEKHNVQIVLNNNTQTISYLGGSATVASDTYDVWLNGELILDDHQLARGSFAVGSPLTSLQFVIWGGGSNEFLIDNLKIYDHAHVIAAPSTGLTFAAWAEANLPEGLRGPDDDAAGDGIENLVKFALGLDPLAPNRADLPVVSTTEENGNDYLSLTFQRFNNAADVEIAVEVSENLVDWTPLANEVEIIEQRDGDLELVRVLDDQTTDGLTRRFLRLSVTQN